MKIAGIIVMVIGFLVMMLGLIGEAGFLVAALGFGIVIIGGVLLQVHLNRKEYLEQQANGYKEPEPRKFKYDNTGHSEELESELAIKCPRCTSNKLQYVERKKVGLKRAVVGSVIAGPAGAVMGGLTGKGKGIYKCLNCGNEFEVK
jgi:DNA-directed RNA polymerase subunit RPC12/RpoP